jgi:hypothetical protein
MLSPLYLFYVAQRAPEYQLGLSAFVLDHDPKEVGALLMRSHAYYQLIKDRYMRRYPNPNDIPRSEWADYQALTASNETAWQQAEALGWHPLTDEESATYFQRIQDGQAKAYQGAKP